MTLTEFLLARISEDEAVAREVLASQQHDVERSPGDWPQGFDPLNDFYLGGADGPIGYTVIMAGVGRVLAECEAKRRIVELRESWAHEAEKTGIPLLAAQVSAADAVIRALAHIYADHPEYDESWRP